MYTISHIPVLCMYEQSYMPFLCFSFLSFFIYFYSTQSYTHFLCFFFLFLVYDYLMVSVTSTLRFRDTLHFTITTTTTTTMTTPPTKPPPPPPRAQTRPPPFREQTGLETQLRLESQVYFFSFLFCFLFFALLTHLSTVCTVCEPRREKKRAQMTPDASFGP